MSISQQQIDMISLVAKALGDLKDEVVFVGGCVTGLLVKDDFTLEQVRFTEDVDLIVNIITPTEWRRFQNQLRNRGFKENMTDNVICRMNLGNLKVDIMPVDENILGFSNQWYEDALQHPLTYEIDSGTNVKIISPEYFIATKIDAYLGRGNNDLLSSHDIEDMLTLFDGRPEVVDEIVNSENNVKEYIAKNLKLLLAEYDFEYVIQGISRNNPQREKIITGRIKDCINIL